ncbi:MAG: ABC transporter ATP-binding protein [bacterium]
MKENSITIENISKSYTSTSGLKKKVLDCLSLKIKSGSINIITGRSGSGKTTLLNIVSALINPDSGSVKVGSKEISSLNASASDEFRAKHIGYIFQTFNLISPLSVRENLYLPSILNGSADKENPYEKAENILRDLGLEEHGDKFPHELSVGQRQRVAIGRTLFKNPSVVLADEPTASIDREAANTVMELFRNLKNDGKTIIVATHDPLFHEIGPDMVFDIETKEVAG